MKQILLISILLISTLFFSFAQPISTFAPVGAEWWYQGLTGFSMDLGYTPTSILQYNSVEELVHEGKLCRRIEVKKYNYIDTVSLSDEFVYNNEDTVFYFSNKFERFVPLYIFNVHQGDTLVFYVSENFPTQDSLFSVIVDSTYLSDFYGESLQTVVLKQAYLNQDTLIQNKDWGFGGINQSFPSAGNYTEKIGCIKGEFISHNRIYFTSIDGHTNPEILCYKDSSFSVVYNYKDTPVDEECLFPGKLSIDNLSLLSGKILVYPNPAREVIQLKLPDGIATPHEIKIFDFTGKVVQTIIASGNNQFSVQNLPQGIYTVAFPVEDNWYYVKMIKL